MPEIKLTPQEKEEYFHSALCNGMSQLSYYGIEITYEKVAYQLAKDFLKAEKPDHVICFEDVLLQILRMGNQLILQDNAGDVGENKAITLQDMYDRVEKSPTWALTQMMEGQDDADTADAILQTVFLQEIIFG